MTNIRSILRWQDAVPSRLRGQTVVVIDVLRWSTVVVTALANGALSVEACDTVDAARDRAMALGRDRVLLGGERNGVAPPGFDLGNSPLEYTAARVEGRHLITTTTNGTQAIQAARDAHEVLIGAFVNLRAVHDRLLTSLRAGRDLTLLAAGQAGVEALEDTACAGALAEWLGDAGEPDAAAQRAIGAWRSVGKSASTAIETSPHAESLRAAGFSADLAYAATESRFACVPILSGRAVVRLA